jgi:hypothetical protein
MAILSVLIKTRIETMKRESILGFVGDSLPREILTP